MPQLVKLQDYACTTLFLHSPTKYNNIRGVVSCTDRELADFLLKTERVDSADYIVWRHAKLMYAMPAEEWHCDDAMLALGFKLAMTSHDGPKSFHPGLHLQFWVADPETVYQNCVKIMEKK